MQVIKPQIQVTLTKTELNTLLTEALTNETASAAIKRALNPLLSTAFPQFPEFTQATLGDIAEDGSITAILRQPKPVLATMPKVPIDSPLKSIEPLVIEETIEDSTSFTQ